MAIPYLITVSGPVSHTYISVYLTGPESDLVRRLAREISTYAIDEHQPGLRIKPLSEASDAELTRLDLSTAARAERATLAATA
ncbi:hypothetical protein ACWIGW_44435 [Nocardia brasiliensis]|uniref:hypothetical protein n=1 Tax=Streptomyces sp. NPDC056056 TaxID=3345698 RepID=UPI0035DBA311